MSYQPHNSDGYYQQYRYDAENRLIAVKTSRDSILWQQDATYRYYRHGPLARIELGDLKVQGIDYAYTVQGWLKSINPSYNNLSGDLYDEDGTTTASARDAYKLNLNYYDDGVYSDYKPINPPTGYVQGNTLPSLARHNLYNGNISSIATHIRALNQPLLYNYQYDQLNRLVSMDAWASNGLFAATGSTAMQDYAERYTYDPNGNILTNQRRGKNRQLDDALYHYVTDKNQLTYISDAAGKPTGSDIEGGQGTTNYGFDPIGEMTSDTKRGLTAATWTVYGKIATQQVSNGTASGTITYTYDAMQNRISKTLTGAGGYTEWYVRDAQGNVMSIYRANDNTLNSGHLTQTEVDVYGSSRIGELTPALDVSQNLAPPLQTVFTRGSKTFELTEQRSNVLATISDKKLQVSTDNNQTVAYYNLDVITTQDYSSFGVIQDGRQSGTTPRFTYNGKQLDRELNWQDYGMRESDAITGRFTSVDPLTGKYPELTPYQYASDRPIDGIDLDGLEYLDMIKGKMEREYQMQMRAKANAQQLEDNYMKSVAMAMSKKPQAQISQAPVYTPAQQKQKEAYRVKRLNEEGYNADGTLQPWAKLATNKTWTNFANNIALPMIGAAIGDGIGKLFGGSTETFYRAMSKDDFAAFVKTGKIPATGETMISPTASYSQDFDGILVQINAKKGTLKQLEEIGVRNIAKNHPNSNLPLVNTVENWSETNAFFKVEGANAEGLPHVNIGLGKGKALETFNNNIKSYNVIGQK